MSSESEYPIVIVQLDEEDGGGYLGFAPDLPGCMSDGETREEALFNTVDALGEWLYEQGERGVDIPSPGASNDEATARERKLLDVIADLVDYRETAGEKIAGLERKLAELISILKDDTGKLPRKISFPSVETARSKLPH